MLTSSSLLTLSPVQLFAAGWGGAVRVWDLRKANKHLEELRGHVGPVTAMQLVPVGGGSGIRLATAGSDWTGGWGRKGCGSCCVLPLACFMMYRYSTDGVTVLFIPLHTSLHMPHLAPYLSPHFPSPSSQRGCGHLTGHGPSRVAAMTA